jgi:hypothetical protein
MKHRADDEYLTFSEAAKTVPGRQVSRSTVWRWARKGVKVRGGSYIHLQHIRRGGTPLTTLAWMTDFFTELARQDQDYYTIQHPNRMKQDVTPISHREAERALKEAGA